MKRLKMNDIRGELRKQHAIPDMPAAAEFWAQANARLDLEQQAAMRRARLTRAQFRMVWSMAAAAAGFAFVIGLLWLNPTAPQPLPTEMVIITPSALKSLDVRGECQSVMTLEGRKNKGTIVLITGMPADRNGVTEQ